MPDSSDSFEALATTTQAQSSLLRISRRHSLPASTPFSNFFILWGNDNDPAAPSSRDHQNYNQHQQPSSNGSPRIVNGNGSGVGGNRHRYGHRHTRSAVIDQPVIVKSYNPGPASSSVASPIHEEEDLEKLALPSIDSFSFDSILKTIEPEVTSTLGAVSDLCAEYQSSLQTEVDGLAEAQSQIDARMKEADKLTTQVLKATKTRTERLDSEASGLKGGAAVDALAEASEATHTALTSIITTLLAIDEMLPPQDRLSPLTSAHKKHYPKLHGLLAEKAHELNVLFRSSRSVELSPTPRSQTGGDEASSSKHQDSSMWVRRRMSSISTSQAVPPTSPTLLRSNTFSYPRGLPSPHLQLRTILPSPSSPSPDPFSASSGAYYPIPSTTATGVSFTSPIGTSIPPISPVPTRRNSGMWGPRSSSSSFAFFPDNLGARNASGRRAETGGWRNSGSWAGFFGGAGRKSSLLSIDDTSEAGGVEERLRRVLEAGSDGRRGKGKGVVK